MGGFLLLVAVGMFVSWNRTPSPAELREPETQLATGEPSGTKPEGQAVGPSENPHYQRGQQLRAAGKLDDAIEAFTIAIKSTPTHAGSYLGRGQSYAALGEFDLAVADFDKAIELNDKFSDAYHERGFAYGNVGKFQQAVENFDQAIRLDAGKSDRRSELARSYANRGFMHFRLGQVTEAKADYDKALEFDASLPFAYYHRAILHRHQSALNESLRDLTQTIKLEPNHTGALYLRAIMLATSKDDSLRDGQQAIADASKACKLTDWNDAGIIAALAAAYAETGEFKKAQELANRANAVATAQQAESIRSFIAPISANHPVRFE